MIRAQNRRQLVRWQLIGSAVNVILTAVCIHFLGAIAASGALYTAEAPRLARAQWRALILATAWLKTRRSPSAPTGGTITPFPLTNAQS